MKDGGSISEMNVDENDARMKTKGNAEERIKEYKEMKK